MRINDITGGTKLELNIFNEDSGEIKDVFVSEFQWAEDEETAIIAAPMREGIIYPLHIGTPLDVYFYKGKGKGYNLDLFRFRAVVTGRDRNDNIELITIRKDGEIYKIQRREYFRFEFAMPIKYRIVENADPITEEDAEYKEAVTVDLSGGGICVRLQEEVPKGSVIECELKLKEKKVIHFLGKVVRLTKIRDSEKYKFEIGVLFEKIDKRSRETLIKFIFEQQRKLRKKGLI